MSVKYGPLRAFCGVSNGFVVNQESSLLYLTYLVRSDDTQGPQCAVAWGTLYWGEVRRDGELLQLRYLLQSVNLLEVRKHFLSHPFPHRNHFLQMISHRFEINKKSVFFSHCRLKSSKKQLIVYPEIQLVIYITKENRVESSDEGGQETRKTLSKSRKFQLGGISVMAIIIYLYFIVCNIF